MQVFSKAVSINDTSERLVNVKVKREDARRGRARLTTATGEDLIIELPRGEAIKDKQIFGPTVNGYYYQINIEPEKVLKVTLQKSNQINDLENAVRLGYNLGNRHLEVLVEKEAVYIPTMLEESKIREMLKRTKLPVDVVLQEKVISSEAHGYYAGEEEDTT